MARELIIATAAIVAFALTVTPVGMMLRNVAADTFTHALPTEPRGRHRITRRRKPTQVGTGQGPRMQRKLAERYRAPAPALQDPQTAYDAPDYGTVEWYERITR